MSIKCVAVYLGSKCGNSSLYTESASQLGEQLAKAGISVVYGGTKVGTMNALANGVIAGNGSVTGVIPEPFVTKSIRHDNLTECIVTKDLKERKSVMENLSQAAIILPGSYGTMDELFEYAVNNQLQSLDRPIVLFNLNGFYDPLIDLFKNMISAGFLTPELFSMIHNLKSVDEIIDFLSK